MLIQCGTARKQLLEMQEKLKVTERDVGELKESHQERVNMLRRGRESLVLLQSCVELIGSKHSENLSANLTTKEKEIETAGEDLNTKIKDIESMKKQISELQEKWQVAAEKLWNYVAVMHRGWQTVARCIEDSKQ